MEKWLDWFPMPTRSDLKAHPYPTTERNGIRNTIMLTGDNPSSHARLQSVSVSRTTTRHAASRQGGGHSKASAGRQSRRNGWRWNQRFAGLEFCGRGHAMKHGAEVTHESADVVLMEDSLWKLVKAVEISRDSVTLIKQNYAIVAGMNTIALALVLPGGLISLRYRADQQWLSHCRESQWHAPSFTLQMKPPAPEQTLAPAHLEALRRALLLLERTSFATQLSEYAGRPANYVLRKMRRR